MSTCFNFIECLSVGFIRQTFFSGIQETVDFTDQLQEPLRVLFDRGSCARGNPSLSASRVATDEDRCSGRVWFFAGRSTILRLRVAAVCGHRTKMPARRQCFML